MAGHGMTVHVMARHGMAGRGMAGHGMASCNGSHCVEGEGTRGMVYWEFPFDWKVNYAASVRFCWGE
jgi:hypothetical protein